MLNDSIENFDKKFNYDLKKSNITTLEENKREQIESYYQVKKELSEEIEKLKEKGENVSILEETFNELEKKFKEITASLDNFEVNEN